MRLVTRGVHVTRLRRLRRSHSADAYATPQTAHGLQLVSVGSLIGRFKPQNSPPRPRRQVAHRKARERSQGSSLAWAGRGGIRETLVTMKDTGIYFLRSVAVREDSRQIHVLCPQSEPERMNANTGFERIAIRVGSSLLPIHLLHKNLPTSCHHPSDLSIHRRGGYCLCSLPAPVVLPPRRIKHS
jgi:hypothetical protein